MNRILTGFAIYLKHRTRTSCYLFWHSSLSGWVDAKSGTKPRRVHATRCIDGLVFIINFLYERGDTRLRVHTAPFRVFFLCGPACAECLLWIRDVFFRGSPAGRGQKVKFLVCVLLREKVASRLTARAVRIYTVESTSLGTRGAAKIFFLRSLGIKAEIKWGSPVWPAYALREFHVAWLC